MLSQIVSTGVWSLT